eukprot:TRINITY_DN2833_c1_g1_i1.p1 TRINITY_DN2833_c1_g1~~TRINITY_DN2833_c1_g1_i1.p1  ORF type:complete len:355 (+),score=32.89 TRINITY_DN2833_c1_g1_i1:24-1067(+)
MSEEEQQEDDMGNVSNPKDDTEVDRWLAVHQLQEYAESFRREGYDDLEDLRGMVKEGDEILCRLIEKGGHRRKVVRLLGGESSMSASPQRAPSQTSSTSHSTIQSPGNVETGRFKVIVVGDAATGKTSYIQQLVHSKFSPNTKATIGLDWREKQFKVAGGYVTVQFWDISGQERFANVTRAYYQGAHGAIVCFDRSSVKSLTTVEKWKEDIDSKVFIGGGTDGYAIPCVLLANKCDLEDKTDNDLKDIAKKYKFEGSFETSAKLNYNILPSIEFLIASMEKHQAALPRCGSAHATTILPIEPASITQHFPAPSSSSPDPVKPRSLKSGKGARGTSKHRQKKKSCSCG